MGCNYLSLPEILAYDPKVLICSHTCCAPSLIPQSHWWQLMWVISRIQMVVQVCLKPSRWFNCMTKDWVSSCMRDPLTPIVLHGPLTRYVKLWVAHAPGMPGTFSPPPWVSDPDMHHDTCVTHVPWCMPGSLTSGFLWSWWRGKRCRHPRRNPQFYLSGKRPMSWLSRTPAG